MSTDIAALASARAAGAGQGAAPAYVEGRTGLQLSWPEVAAIVEAWVAAAGAAGLAPGSPVALLAQRPLSFIGAFLGLLAAGAVVLPLNAGADGGPQAEAAAAIAEFGAVAVATDAAAGHAAAEETGIPAWVVPTAGGPSVLGTVAPSPPSREAWVEPATVILRTSGSTGRPKGVPLRERQLLHNAAGVARHHRLAPGERLYSSLPLVHINAEVTGVLAALVAGSTMVVDDRFRRAGFWDVLDHWGITVLNAVPAILALLAQEAPPPDAVATRVRFARSASAPLPATTCAAFEERSGIRILETYGMTEAAGQICANPLDPWLRKAGSVGLPVDIELRVVGEDRRPVDPGMPGDIEIRGPSVTAGYVLPAGPGQPPRRVARPGQGEGDWLPTGDVGLRDADGFVFLLGRIDGVVNRGGEKIYPREVEEVLRRHPAVADAVVLGEPDPVLGQRLVALVVPVDASRGAPGIEDELLALCRAELDRHKRPARVQIAERLPQTPTGKVRRDRLYQLLSAGAPPSAASEGAGL